MYHIHKSQLVGGFNPSESNSHSRNGNLPQIGVNQHIWGKPPVNRQSLGNHNQRVRTREKYIYHLEPLQIATKLAGGKKAIYKLTCTMFFYHWNLRDFFL